jgi:hypothetical protein
MIKALFERGEHDGVTLNVDQWTTSAPMVKAVIKGIITRDLYEDGAYYRPVNPLLPEYQAALKLINDPKRYNKLLNK